MYALPPGSGPATLCVRAFKAVTEGGAAVVQDPKLFCTKVCMTQGGH